MASASRESVFGVRTRTARKTHRSGHAGRPRLVEVGCLTRSRRPFLPRAGGTVRSRRRGASLNVQGRRGGVRPSLQEVGGRDPVRQLLLGAAWGSPRSRRGSAGGAASRCSNQSTAGEGGASAARNTAAGTASWKPSGSSWTSGRSRSALLLGTGAGPAYLVPRTARATCVPCSRVRSPPRSLAPVGEPVCSHQHDFDPQHRSYPGLRRGHGAQQPVADSPLHYHRNRRPRPLSTLHIKRPWRTGPAPGTMGPVPKNRPESMQHHLRRHLNRHART